MTALLQSRVSGDVQPSVHATGAGLCISPALRERLAALPLRRLHARHQLLNDLHTEPFMGNLWRGQLGAWWHENAPATFDALMGSEDRGRLWALKAPWSDEPWVPAGAVLETRITLIGPAVAHEAAVLDALAALGQLGLGGRAEAGRRSHARILDLYAESLPGCGDAHTDALALLESDVEHGHRFAVGPGSEPRPIQVTLSRPLRIKRDGEVFVGLPSMEQLLRRTLGRLVQILPMPEPESAPAHLHDGSISAADHRSGLFDPDEHAAWMRAADECVCLAHELHAWQWKRHSRRSGRDMPLEGLTGRLHYQGNRAMLLPWLQLADWLQIGSKTTFGFGAIEAV